MTKHKYWSRQSMKPGSHLLLRWIIFNTQVIIRFMQYLVSSSIWSCFASMNIKYLNDESVTFYTTHKHPFSLVISRVHFLLNWLLRTEWWEWPRSYHTLSIKGLWKKQSVTYFIMFHMTYLFPPPCLIPRTLVTKISVPTLNSTQMNEVPQIY